MQLLEFPHSHYCEKARWALEYKGIPYERVAILPGFHLFTVRRYAPKTSVPVLLDSGVNVQGSGEIIDYLDKLHPDRLLTPIDSDIRQHCLTIERSMDDRLGENVRRILYHTLLDYPDFIRYCFTHSMPKMKQFVFSLFYPLLRQRIYQTYVISDDRVEQAKQSFATAMSEVEQQIADKDYLVGNEFSRADISVASMLSLLVLPEQHPLPWIDIPDPHAKQFIETYRSHPVSEWVRMIYGRHRA